MKKTQKQKLIFVVGAVIFLLLCTIGVMASGYILHGDDVDFHFARFGGIREGILGGQFPIKYYNSWAYSGGYFSPIFYGDVFLIPFVLLSFVGIPLIVCYYLFLYVLYFTIWGMMYLLAKKYLKHDILSILCATVFATSNYIFVDCFFRVALGECIAVIFYLVLLLGIYNMLHENYSKPWLLVIAFIGILLSHTITFFFAGITLTIVVLCNCQKLFKQKQFWIKSSLVFGVFLVIGLYFIASFIEMYFADTYNIVNNAKNINYTASYRALDLGEIFYSIFAVGIVLVVAVVLRCFIFRLKASTEDIKLINRFLIIALVLVVITSKAFPWKWFDNSLGIVQFPWRLNFIVSIFICIALSLEIKIVYYNHINWSRFVFVFIMLVALIINNVSYITYFRKEREMNTFYNRKVEWYPEVTQIEDFQDRNIYDNEGNAIDYTRKYYTTEIDFLDDGENEYYIVPLVYYKGYEAVHTDENGKRTNLTVAQHTNGMMLVQSNGLKGQISIRYVGTTVQNVTFVISLVGTLTCVVSAVIYAVRRRKTVLVSV